MGRMSIRERGDPGRLRQLPPDGNVEALPINIFIPNKDVHYDSPAGRLKVTREVFDHLPAWRCQTFRLNGSLKSVFYLCGKCFGKRGNGPATNMAEMWKPGSDASGKLHYEVVPKNAVCEQCHERAWPAD